MSRIRHARQIITTGLAVITLSGCIFIIEDDRAAKYYGIDEQRGGRYLDQIVERQQQVYDAANGPERRNK